MEKRPRKAKSFKGCKKLTQQHHAVDTNINTIVNRMIGGHLPSQNVKQPFFADISGVGTFHEMQNFICKVNQNFMRLPAKIRARFKNDPRNLVEFLQDDTNRREAEALGLTAQKAKEPKEPSAAPNADAPKDKKEPSQAEKEPQGGDN